MSRHSPTLNAAKWISVKQARPKVGQRLILRIEGNGTVFARSGYRRDNWGGGFCTQRTGGGLCIQGVSHWLPWPKV